ncbi:ABC transporter substrate-binding protein [Thermaerobacter sp. PB12/4term]|uniref:ABC transporter substrate-binding protein n=1 Tax=Thermaerobacter sp. PB12/4term TaxID=2293838 RepID=UPI0019401C09|nr:ABC transporter substrate-binding protein [Thermaerobacter sp. PB12/4term]
MARSWRWIAGLALAAMLLAACSQGGTGAGTEGSGGDQDSNQLTVIGPWSGAEMEQFLPVLEEAERRLGITIQYQTQRYEDLAQVLPAQFEAGQAPADVIFMWDWWVKEHAQDAVDLKDIWEPEAGAFRMPAAEAGGQVVAVPYALTVKPGFWYRKSFFAEHGLEVPATWDEFVALLQRLAEIEGVQAPVASGDGTGWPLSDVVEHFLIAFGGPDLQRDLIEGRIAWTDPKVQEVFRDRLVPVLEYFSDPMDWTQAVDLWWQGEYGLYFMGNWLTGLVDDPSDLGVFPLPGARGMVAATDYVFVPRHSPRAEKAKQLVAFLISREGMELRARQGGKLSGRNDVPAEAHPAVDQEVARLLEGAELLPDLDDAIGGDWQRTFWDQLKLLWVEPGQWQGVLERLEQERGR